MKKTIFTAPFDPRMRLHSVEKIEDSFYQEGFYHKIVFSVYEIDRLVEHTVYAKGEIFYYPRENEAVLEEVPDNFKENLKEIMFWFVSRKT